MKRLRRLCQHAIILVFSVLFLLSGVTYPTEAEEENVETIRSTFFVVTAQEYHTMDVRFSADWFKQDSRIYSHDLAKLSLGLTTSAFRPSKKFWGDYKSPDENLCSFLTEAHFEDLRSDDYDKDPSMYTVSTVMGHQKIGEGDEAFELIAVGVCGQGYIDEWESNFTIGNELIHQGFHSSSDLVFDRICGYIAANHLEGPYKVWISGFSRAAAISNLTAAKLTDSNLFREENVFAYTFATPRTVRDPNAARYTNIFNIVGKADPVPCVPFAEWGYDRYGITLYLPVMETDSDFDLKREKADEIYKNLTGIDYWYNREANSLLKMVMAYLLELCPTAQVYTEHFQDKIIRIWEKRDPVTILSNLLDIANDPIVINEKNESEANALLNYLVLIIRDFTNQRTVFRRWNHSASLVANIMQAHTPELYISWVYSTDSGETLYNTSSRYTMVYVDSPLAVTLYRDGEKLETLPGIMKYDYVSKERIELIPKDQRVVPEDYRYLDYTDDFIMVLIPHDREYQFVVEAADVREGICFMQFDYSVGKQTADHITLTFYDIPEHGNMRVTFTPDNQTSITSDTEFHEEDFYREEYELQVSDVQNLIRSDMFGMRWADAVMLIISVTLLVIFLLLFQMTYLIARFRFNRRVKRGWIPSGVKFNPVPILCVFTIFMLFLIMEFYRFLLPDNTNMLLLFKAIIGILSVLIALSGYLRRKRPLSGFIMLSLLVMTAADIVMTESIYVGPILHSISYLILSYAFMREEKMEKKQIILWGVAVLAMVVAAILIRGKFGALRILAIIYSASALLMIVNSFSQQRRVMSGSILLFISGLLVMYNEIQGKTFFSHLISLGTYYVAIALLASSCTRVPLAKLVPQMPETGEMEV